MARQKPDTEQAEQLLTRRQLAEMLNVHMQTVTKWEREGLPIAKRGDRGTPSLYREVDVRAWLQVRAEEGNTPQKLDQLQERARKDRAQAALAEQMFKIRERDLLPRDEVEKAWGAEVAAVRALLLSWSQTLSDRVFRAAKVDGLAGVERVLQDAVRDVLRELSGEQAAA